MVIKLTMKNIFLFPKVGLDSYRAHRLILENPHGCEARMFAPGGNPLAAVVALVSILDIC